MTWIISWVLAGVMITTNTSAPARTVTSQPKAPVPVVAPAIEDAERFDQTYPLSAGGRVAVSNVNGSITVETWDRAEVKVEAVKTADDKERLADITIKVDARADSVKIETEYESRRLDGRNWKNYGKMSVDYKLTVPRGAALDEIETVNGSVTITNASNVTKASAVNGQVKAFNLSGAAELSTVNGTVEATFDTIVPGGRIDLETVNGTVLLTLPSDANATVKADTVNGKIENEFGLPVRKGQYVGRDLYGRLGSGDTRINLSSVNGALSIKRRADGKTPAPAVDLLQQKDSDDVSVAVAIDSAKMNRDIEKAVRESQKEVARSMAESRKEIEEAQRELAKARDEMSKVDFEAARERLDIVQNVSSATLAGLTEAGFFPAAPTAETSGETFTVSGKPTVNIDARDCSVNVRGWDRNEVKYSITRISRRRDVKPLSTTVDHSDSKVTIRVVQTKGDDDFMQELEKISIEVFVPRKTDLRVTTERQLRVENVSGDIDLKGFGESVDVRDSDGKLLIASDDARVRVIGFKGEIESQNSDGEVSLEGDFSRLSAKTGDGSIVVTLPDNASATVQSDTEEVEFVGLAATTISKADAATSSWKIGDGNAKLTFSASDGRFMVRSAGSLRTGK